jgi:hypothetical protein
MIYWDIGSLYFIKKYKDNYKLYFFYKSYINNIYKYSDDIKRKKKKDNV